MTLLEAMNDIAEHEQALAKAHKAMAEVLKGLTNNKNVWVKESEVLTTEPDKKTAKDEKTTNTKNEQSEITVGMIRTVLAEKSQAGLTLKVKELLNGFGAEKLSAVKPEDYNKLYEAAKALS